MLKSSRISNTYIPEKHRLWWNERKGDNLSRVVKIYIILWQFNINPLSK